MTKTTAVQEQLYRELFEKYAKRERDRSIVAVVMGTLSVVGAVLAARRLRELRADRLAVSLFRGPERTP